MRSIGGVAPVRPHDRKFTKLYDIFFGGANGYVRTRKWNEWHNNGHHGEVGKLRQRVVVLKF